MHFRRVNIHRDETAAMEVLVGDWEVAILEAKLPEGSVQPGNLVEHKNRAWPDSAASEMQRLTRLYGMTGAGDEAVSWAERVYGTGRAGVSSLDRAIKEARATAEKFSEKHAALAADLLGATG